MPRQVIFGMVVELALVLMTIFILVNPLAFLRARREQSSRAQTYGGLFLLCLTFCWSVIFGCILALNSMTFTL